MLSYVQKRRGIAQAKSCIVAYRVTSGGGNPEETAEGEEQQDESASTYVTEGYDDSNEEGSGQKLLSLLQRMGVENILILVFIWHQRMPGHNSSEVYRNVLERAKDLLTTLHVRVLEAEALLQQRLEQNASGNLALTYQGEDGQQRSQGGLSPDGKRNFDSVYDLRDRLNT